MRKDYEIFLLEIRQCIKEAQNNLRNRPCIDLYFYRRLIELNKTIKSELVGERIGNADRNRYLSKMNEG